MQDINLIPMQRQRARQQRARLRAWIGGGIIYAALVAIVCVGYRTAASPKDLAALHQELADMDTELASLKQQRDALRPQLNERRLILAAGRSISDQPDWSRMLTYLADEVLGDTVVLTHCQLMPDTKAKEAGTRNLQDLPLTFTVTGFAKSAPEVSQFVLRLEQMALFDKVVLVQTSRESLLNDMAIAFEVHCELLPHGGVKP